MMRPDLSGRITRRRFIRVTAMCAAGSFSPPASGARMQPLIWQGRAMGADAAITLYHPDRLTAEQHLARCQALIISLENQLSLYQRDSALCRLNRNGVLDEAPQALLDILWLASDIHQLTDGAFDVTVQPLWQLYAGHFSRADASPAGPPVADIGAARDRVDASAIHIEGRKIIFTRPGMAVTLNGIAQGYITDRVAELLRAAGMDNVLLDLGEFRALGPHLSGRTWRIGIQDPRNPWRMLDIVPLNRGAIATSGGYGAMFDAGGKFHHLFDPASGRPARHYRSLSISGPDAARADALSTGLSALPLEKALAVLEKLGPEWGACFVPGHGAATRHNWPAQSNFSG